MHPGIQVRIEGKRGCGFRKPGGFYLVCDGPGRPCGKLPLPLHVCPTCSAGIKPARGWTWIDGSALATQIQCHSLPCRPFCPLSGAPGRVGLIWVGEQYYPAPEHFDREATRMGISRRLGAIPNGFVPRQTWVWLAHRKTCVGPAVFRVFLPERIEVVVAGNERDAEIDQMIKRGLTPVLIKTSTQQPSFSLDH